MKGSVKFFSEDKHFGFIAGEDGKEYFVHASGILPGGSITKEDQVEFEAEAGDKGVRAVKVKKI
ncbi:cold shock domain-containing protein [Candidatus Woesearchaeota archaeon]|nr:cold shock domain-containing protein [Candidatus Woesearchaeota archaeon]